MRIHFIAIGGSAMHNLALALHDVGHKVSGSDDEIYEPSRSRLEKEGLLPSKFGWSTYRITKEIDAIILGMHARIDNPELIKAQELKIPIYSYPEFVAKECEDKTKIVVAGSHGKTTTTSMIMHVLSQVGMDYDYLVGAQLNGFDRMVKLSDANIVVLEGDEYLSSPIDRRPKMMHYKPNVAVITGVAWDHINVFPTLDIYVDQFRQFILKMEQDDTLYWYAQDGHLQSIIGEGNHLCDALPYTQIELAADGKVHVDNESFELSVIGNHNLQNIKAAESVCLQLGITKEEFYEALESFTGANKRLQVLEKGKNKKGYVYLDFAHAPSKVKATTNAVKDWYGETPLIAVFELHTYSSLNSKFLPNYKHALEKADKAVVFYSEHALKMKKMENLDSDYVASCFAHDDLQVISTSEDLEAFIKQQNLSESNLLLMSSGTFEGLDLTKIG